MTSLSFYYAVTIFLPWRHYLSTMTSLVPLLLRHYLPLYYDVTSPCTITSLRRPSTMTSPPLYYDYTNLSAMASLALYYAVTTSLPWRYHYPFFPFFPHNVTNLAPPPLLSPSQDGLRRFNNSTQRPRHRIWPRCCRRSLELYRRQKR